MSRRATIATWVIVAAVVAVAAVAVGVVDTLYPKLETVTVPVPGLTRTYRILEATDLHGAEFGPRQAKIAALVRGKHFDAVVLAGDLQLTLGKSRVPALDLARVLQKTAPATLFVQGNHDDGTMGPALDAIRVRDLGVEGAGTFGGIWFADLAQAQTTRPPSYADFEVVLKHGPPSDAAMAQLNRDRTLPTLVICGHMHGGQVRLPLIGAVFAPPTDQHPSWQWFPELRGIHVQGAFRDGRIASYISPGLGSRPAFFVPDWLRFRWGTRAQLTEIVAVPAR